MRLKYLHHILVFWGIQFASLLWTSAIQWNNGQVTGGNCTWLINWFHWFRQWIDLLIVLVHSLINSSFIHCLVSTRLQMWRQNGHQLIKEWLMTSRVRIRVHQLLMTSPCSFPQRRLANKTTLSTWTQQTALRPVWRRRRCQPAWRRVIPDDFRFLQIKWNT